jgi:hypothetical protein
VGACKRYTCAEIRQPAKYKSLARPFYFNAKLLSALASLFAVRVPVNYIVVAATDEWENQLFSLARSLAAHNAPFKMLATCVLINDVFLFSI